MTEVAGKEKRSILNVSIDVNWTRLRRGLMNGVVYLRWPVTILITAFLLRNYRFESLRWIKPNWDMILRYIDVLRWPLIVLLALAMLRPYLPEIIKRLRKATIGNSGLELDQAVDPKVSQEIKEINDTKPQVAEMNVPDASGDLETLLTSDDAKKAYIEAYKGMFGTQLEALRLLLDYEHGLSADDLKPLLDKHKSIAPNPYPSVLEFMGYLKGNVLVLYEPSEKLFKLTNAGLYFLAYLKSVNLLDVPKPY